MTKIRGLAVKLLMVFLFGAVVVNLKAQSHTPRFVSITANSNGYYEYLPQGYGSEPVSYPVIIFLHGMGELGNGGSDLGKVLNNALPRLIQQGNFPSSFYVNSQTHKFIVISPQWIKWPKPLDINAVVDFVISNYRVNSKKIYVTGLSMGGGATWEYVGDAALYNRRIAAVVPIAGASWPDVGRSNRIADALLPVWATHNDGDPTAPVSYTNTYIQNILNRNPNAPVKKTIFSSSSHDAWTRTYDPSFRENGQNVYEWMLQYESGNVANQNPVSRAGADISISLPTNSVVLNGSASFDPDGTIAGYLWTKISGPTQFSFSSATVSKPTISNLAQGQYIFRLRVTDNKGAVGYDDVTVNVAASIATNKLPVVNAGTDITITLPTNSFSLSGSATDSDGQITRYLWIKASGPDEYSFSNSSSNTTTVNNVVAGQYVFRLHAVDDKDEVGSDDVTVTVLPAPVTNPGTRRINVNIFRGAFPYNNAEWNNWDVGSQASAKVSSGVFKYSTGASSSVSATLSVAGTVADNGAGYGSGMAPAEVLRHTSYSTVLRTLTIAGLSPQATYNLELYASRNSTSSGNTVFTINQTSQSIATSNNKTQKALFANVSANSQGQIVVSIQRTATFTYLNGFSITENSSTTATASSTSSMSNRGGNLAESITEDVDAKATITVSPNPVSEHFVLNVTNSYRGPVTVRLVDASGTVVQQFQSVKEQANFVKTYFISKGVGKGSFNVIVIQGKRTQIARLIKL